MDALLDAYPALPLQTLGVSAVAAAVHGGAARAPAGSFAILRAALDASSSLCAGAAWGAAPQTLFAPTDAAWEALAGQLGRGLGEVLSTPALLCSLLAYNAVAPCGSLGGTKPAEAACGALPTAALVDQQQLVTPFGDASLLQADAASAALYVAVHQAFAKRRLRVTGYLKRGAALLVPDLALCGGLLVVHVTDAVLVPAAALYSDMERRVRDTPELSITAEAYDRCVCARYGARAIALCCSDVPHTPQRAPLPPSHRAGGGGGGRVHQHRRGAAHPAAAAARRGHVPPGRADCGGVDAHAAGAHGRGVGALLRAPGRVQGGRLRGCALPAVAAGVPGA